MFHSDGLFGCRSLKNTLFFDSLFRDDTPLPTRHALAPHKAPLQGNFRAALNEKQFPSLVV